MLDKHQEAPAETVLGTGHGHTERGVLSHTAPKGWPCYAQALSGPSLMCEPLSSRLGWEVQQTGNV